MHWIHPDHEGRRVRLAYCLNLHAADDLDGVLGGMRAITLPLRERLAPGATFGVGLYLPARIALALEADPAALGRLTELVTEHGLDPFTHNAFPFGGFHAAGLKAAVFEPTWMQRERLDFTLAVARIAAHLADATGGFAGDAHVSISTHPGFFGPVDGREDDLDACARNLARCADGLAQIEERVGLPIVLAVEAEPRASAGDTAALARLLEWMRERGADLLAAREGLPRGYAAELLRRHLGTCLDCCHSAVEFESAERSLADATANGAPLGKLQFSSALALRDPAAAPEGVAALLALEEPRYLHQVTGSRGPDRERVADLPELSAALADPERRPAWESCSEWRCHFHVPVDLGRVGAEGAAGPSLGTTRAHADRILRHALADPASWNVRELHLEIETYTWDVLPGPARGAGDLVDGLEREYAHVIAILEGAGWTRA